VAARSSEAMNRIERVAKGSATHLDLAHLGLVDVPDAVGSLTRLTSLDLSGNGLTELPEWLGSLTQLTTLHVFDNRLTELPEWLGSLTQLTGLNLNRNRLTELPEWLGSLTQLTGLGIGDNGLTTLPDALGSLTQLTELGLYSNPLTELPEWLRSLTQLDGLGIGEIGLAELPEWLGSLTQLTRLNLDENRLTALPDWLGSLTQLTRLNLDGNRLTALPDWLGSLTQLTRLDIGRNLLTALPDWLSSLPELTRLNLEGNPLDSPPPEVVAGGTAAVLAFLRDRVASGTARMWRSKLLVVGEATVGKTSLAKQLTGGTYDPGEGQTHGVHVDALELKHPGMPDTTMHLSVWDFGGQLEYRATQRFYLTDRSLFVLVWNARARWQDGKLLAWLDTITARAPSSPILLVATHRDDASEATLPEDLRERFPRIAGFYEVDAKSGEGIDQAREAVRHESASLPLMGAAWPGTWVQATRELQAIDTHAVPTAQVWAAMAAAGVDDAQSQRALARSLHDLGDVVFFAEDRVLNDKMILNPAWLDARITAVLDSAAVARARGVLTRAERARLWHDLDPDMHERLVRIMERFDLAYRVGDSDHSEDVALVVERLGYARPADADRLWRQALKRPGVREIGFDFTLHSRQAGIPSWFIARQHYYTTGLHWAHGVLLHDRNPDHPAYALVLDDEAERPTISIRVRGRYPARLLSVLTEAFESIVESRYPGLVRAKSVPCVCQDVAIGLCGHSFSLRELELELEDPDPDADHKVRCPVSGRKIEARSMLDGLRGSGISRQLDRLADAQITTLQRIDQRQLATLNGIRALLAHRTRAGVHCPSLFAVEDLGRSRLLRKRTYQVSLWCEWPEQPHDLDGQGVYTLTSLPPWLRNYLPFLHALVTTLGILIPVIAPATAAAGLQLGKRAEGTLDTTGKTMDTLSKLSTPNSEADFFSPDAGQGPLHHAQITADFRVLRNALTQLDPQQLWGALSPAIRSEDNGVIYLCDTHLHALDHPYQHNTDPITP
jgi:internalin A